MDVPEVRYTRTGGVAIAYQVVGEGAQALVFAPQLTNLYVLWRRADMGLFLNRLARGVRLVVFNPRGTGLSDRPRNVTLEARMDDISAVLDSNEIERATIFGVQTSANVCALFAATYPDRCERLVIVDAYPRAVRSHDYPFGISDEEWLAGIRSHREHWGERDYLESFLRRVDPASVKTAELLDARVWELRLALSPAGAAEFARMGMETDITDVLGAIRVPTLILHRSDQGGAADYVARHVRDARVVDLGSDTSLGEETADLVLEFIKGSAGVVVPDSVLATLLFTDLVRSTEHAAALGDRSWRDVLETHHRLVRRELVRHRGIEVDTAGDGFFCRFDGPARAIACAHAIVEGSRTLELEVRAGIHTGECEMIGDKIAGIAVVTGARISSLAAAGEVLVSSTVKDLVAGSGFAFDERGEHELKGVPGSWRLYAVADA